MFLSVLLVLLAPAIFAEEPPVSSLNLPLSTQRATAVPKGTLSLDTYLEYERTPEVRFRSPEGFILRAPVLAIGYAMADGVELQGTFPTQVYAKADNGRSYSEVGDFTIWTKWAFLKEKASRPAVAVRWGVKLPNSSDTSGLGTDQPDIFVQGLASRTFGDDWRLDTNLGLAILGDPTQTSYQGDAFTYGVAVARALPRDMEAMLEFVGTTGKGYLPGQSVFRAGLSFPGPRALRFYGAFTAGMTPGSPDWGLRAGAHWTFLVGKNP